MYNNSVTLLVNTVDIMTIYCAYEPMYIIHILYTAMYITLYCAYEAMCIHVYTAMYILIAVAHSLLMKGYRAKVHTERYILSLVLISLTIIRRIKRCCFFLGAGTIACAHVHVFFNAHCPVPPITNWCKEF